MITAFSVLPKLLPWKLGQRMCPAGDLIVLLLWGMSLAAAAAVQHAGASAYANPLDQNCVLLLLTEVPLQNWVELRPPEIGMEDGNCGDNLCSR